jgi:anti-sigma factor RsiW
MNEHEWFNERIAAHLTGGLAEDELLRFEAHWASCSDCSHQYAELEQTEKTMTQLFAAVAPDPDFENRILGRLRFSAPRLRINPIVQRAAVAAAAAMVLGGAGWSQSANRTRWVGYYADR